MAQISAADFTEYDADIIMEIYVAEKIMLMSAKGRGLEMVGKRISLKQAAGYQSCLILSPHPHPLPREREYGVGL
jgi:hypothetical protein